jgi:cytochrome P450
MVIIGQMFPSFFPFDPLAFGLGIARRYGDIAHYRLGPLHVYQVNHPDPARQILVEQPEKFYKPKLVKRAFRPIAGEGLLMSDGALWKQQHRLVQPAFHQRRLAVYGEVMVVEALQLVAPYRDGEIRDVGMEMAKLTLGVVVKTLFGSELPVEPKEVGRLMVAVLKAGNRRVNSPLRLRSWVPTRANLREREAFAGLDRILWIMIQNRRASGESGDDLLSVLLSATDEESNAGMTEQQLRDELMTLFLAGHETTATALTWTWYLLARHQEVEAKLLRELRDVLAGREPAMEDLPNLPYTDMVVRESMRLYPPAPGFAREPIEDVTIGGWDIPKGSLVVVNTYALQHDARFFPEPERFEPERFAKGWEERMSRYAYLPFGGGPRVCIGNGFAMMEARLILATIAQKWRLTPESTEEIAPVQLLALRPGRPVRMRLERRL